MVCIKGELPRGFCRRCALRMVGCAAYGVEIARTLCGCPICIEITAWMKVCGTCLKAEQIDDPNTETPHVCRECLKAKERFLGLVFRNPDKRSRFGRHPVA